MAEVLASDNLTLDPLIFAHRNGLDLDLRCVQDAIDYRVALIADLRGSLNRLRKKAEQLRMDKKLKRHPGAR